LNSVTAYIGLGANLADPTQQIRAGVQALAGLPQTRLAAVSSLYRTAPVGYADQPDFINAVAQLDTTLAPWALLEALLAIERRHGRVRAFVNAPRTLDLDLLLYGEAAVTEPGLTIPHPRMHERAFVMAPLAEIAPDAQVPGRGRVRDLLKQLDTSSVVKLEAAAES
jgi:2-amino-4-hydroxy-6-hydroxymethyldihydropteridine diphosphokinase